MIPHVRGIFIAAVRDTSRRIPCPKLVRPMFQVPIPFIIYHEKREYPRIICCIRHDCNVIVDLSEMARRQSLPLNSLDLGLACWGDSENMFSLPDFFEPKLIIIERLFGILGMERTFNTDTLTCLHLLGIHRFLSEMSSRKRRESSCERSKPKRILGMRARSIYRRDKASLARNVGEIGKLISTMMDCKNLIGDSSSMYMRPGQ